MNRHSHQVTLLREREATGQMHTRDDKDASCSVKDATVMVRVWVLLWYTMWLRISKIQTDDSKPRVPLFQNPFTVPRLFSLVLCGARPIVERILVWYIEYC
jgi:hypothetical protein